MILISMVSIPGPVVTPISSPKLFIATEAGTSSVSSSDRGTSPFFIFEINEELKKEISLGTKQTPNLSEINGELKKEISLGTKETPDLDESSSDTDSGDVSSSSSSLRLQPWMTEILSSRHQSWQHLEENSHRSNERSQTSTTKALLESKLN
ncbi:hypothetical protein Vadar_004077 [Vaccinium darrowii]|uniref:Uncharacterized protein n=1 Tax=Vaccinium darrowii TaxID=229202 RepID=A0ACB7Z957_9ERIC|nr:hypothetical protein Vadar_004077 [Vaccinium darrowii]